MHSVGQEDVYLMKKDTTPFEVQGHRGARGLKPENTLPSFETAFDVGVTSIETDVHLTRDSVPVLIHDPRLNARLYRPLAGSPASALEDQPAVARLSLSELRGYRADGNPDPKRFPDQDPSVTPLARVFAQQRGYDPYAVPTLADLFAFAAAYAGELGRAAGKTRAQQEHAREIVLDLELKREPFHAEYIGDGFDGSSP